jgi:hypothetical protein
MTTNVNDCPLALDRTGYHGKYHRGHRRCIRAAKRREALKRNGNHRQG